MRSPIVALTLLLAVILATVKQLFEGWGVQRDTYIFCVVMLATAVIAGSAIVLTLLQNSSPKKNEPNGRDQSGQREST